MFSDVDAPVHHLVIALLVEGVVEAEVLVFEVLRQIDLRLGLVHHHVVFGGYRDDVDLLAALLLPVERSLAHAHADGVVGDGFGRGERTVLEAVSVLSATTTLDSHTVGFKRTNIELEQP